MRLWDQAKSAWRKLRNDLISVSNPRLLELFNLGPRNYSGVSVGEHSALGLSALYRAVDLISTTVASLPLKTLREVDGIRTRVPSFLDNPGGPNGPTRFEWVETLMSHLLLHGNAYAFHVYNGAGTIVALELIHPQLVQLDWELDSSRKRTGRKLFTVTLEDGTSLTLTEQQMTHIPAMSLDGLRGLSVIDIARNSLGTAIAGDRAAAKMFAHGALHHIVATADEDMEEAEAQAVKTQLSANVGGWENAAELVVLNRKMKLTPLSMSFKDAQWLESRQFSVEEIARWFGVPPHLLMQTEKQTSWGTGVAEQNRALARFTLTSWTSRIEQRLSRLLSASRFCEFDYAGLLKPAPEQEIPLLIQQVQAGLMTPNEARRIRGMDPIEGGDQLVPVPQRQQLEAVSA